TPEVDAIVRDCARIAGEDGAMVTEACPPAIEKSRTLFNRLFGTDGGAWVRRILERVGTSELYPFLKWTDKREDRPESPASEFTLLLEEVEEFRRGMLGFLENYDVILAPAHASAALSHRVLTSSDWSPAFSYAQTYNLTGWPCVVVRAGTSPEGLPIGVQVVARPWQEHVALAVARRIEEAFGGWQAPAIPGQQG